VTVIYLHFHGSAAVSCQLTVYTKVLTPPDENGADAVRDRLASASVAPSAFSPTYPVPLDLSALLQAPIDLTLCEVRNTPGGDVQLVFCSRRDVEERLTVDKTSTPAVMSAFSQALGGYDRFVAYKYTHVQVFDVVTIRPKLERIEISLDIAQRGYFFDSSIHAMKLTNAVSLLVPDLVFEGQSPRNLFSAIEGIYSAPKTTDVNIIDIGFRTASGAVNRGKMPTVHEDIREERFHKAGAVADKQVTPNGVIGAWTFMHPRGGAKIKLWVPVSQAASSNPVLDSMEVRDAKADSDVLQAVNKVVKYL